MIERLLRWLGLRPRAAETIVASGRLDLTIDGERWTAVTSLAGRGPDARVYVIRTDGDTASVTFGDGQTGRRPPSGAAVTATYREGVGAIGNVPAPTAPATPATPNNDPLRTLLDLLAQMADRLSAAQDQIASEAYLETSSGSAVPLIDADAVRRACADSGHSGIDVRIRFQPWTDRDRPW